MNKLFTQIRISYNKKRLKKYSYENPINTYSQYGEHHLRNIERMPPIMISYIAVVLLHTQKPSAKYCIIYMEPFGKV